MKFKKKLKSVSLAALGAALVLVIGACSMENPVLTENANIETSTNLLAPYVSSEENVASESHAIMPLAYTSSAARASFVTLNSAPVRPTNPPISDDRAVEIARDYVGILPGEPGGRQNFSMSYENGRWAWRFWLSGSRGGLFHIDVETGEVLLFDPDATITLRGSMFDAIRAGSAVRAANKEHTPLIGEDFSFERASITTHRDGQQDIINIDIPRIYPSGSIEPTNHALFLDSVTASPGDTITFDIVTETDKTVFLGLTSDRTFSDPMFITGAPGGRSGSFTVEGEAQRHYLFVFTTFDLADEATYTYVRGTVTIERAANREHIPLIGEDFSFEIPHIAAGEVVLIGRVTLSPDNPLTVVVSAEDISGHGFFMALNNSPDIQRAAGIMWSQLRGNRMSATMLSDGYYSFTLTSNEERIAYLYIGSGLGGITASGGFSFGEGSSWARNGNIANIIGRVYGVAAEVVSGGAQTEAENTIPIITGNFEVDIPLIRAGEIVLIGRLGLEPGQTFEVELDFSRRGLAVIGISNTPYAVENGYWSGSITGIDNSSTITLTYTGEGFRYLYVGCMEYFFSSGRNTADLVDVSLRLTLLPTQTQPTQTLSPASRNTQIGGMAATITEGH